METVEVGVDRVVPLKHWLPMVVPACWVRVAHPMGAPSTLGCCFVDRERGLSMIADASIQDDGKAWVHVSVAGRRRLPTYAELVEVKETFIGADKHALMKLPPRSQHVNIHPNALHLFSCLDGDVTPDFTKGTGSL